MLITTTCPNCGATVSKDPRMLPHFVKLTTICPSCGEKVHIPYKPGKKEGKTSAA